MNFTNLRPEFESDGDGDLLKPSPSYSISYVTVCKKYSLLFRDYFLFTHNIYLISINKTKVIQTFNMKFYYISVSSNLAVSVFCTSRESVGLLSDLAAEL